MLKQTRRQCVRRQSMRRDDQRRDVCWQKVSKRWKTDTGGEQPRVSGSCNARCPGVQAEDAGRLGFWKPQGSPQGLIELSGRYHIELMPKVGFK